MAPWSRRVNAANACQSSPPSSTLPALTRHLLAPRQPEMLASFYRLGEGVGGRCGPRTGNSSGLLPGNSSGRGGSPGSCTGGGTSGLGLPGGLSCGGSDGCPGWIGGSSCGSIGVSLIRNKRRSDCNVPLRIRRQVSKLALATVPHKLRTVTHQGSTIQ